MAVTTPFKKAGICEDTAIHLEMGRLPFSIVLEVADKMDWFVSVASGK
ncbi:MAG: hypothetical protein GX127_03875 [Eubacteriaceae bacterium]|nr:hypothetical protein [Eubacteriaceae bacterium]